MGGHEIVPRWVGTKLCPVGTKLCPVGTKLCPGHFLGVRFVYDLLCLSFICRYLAFLASDVDLSAFSSICRRHTDTPDSARKSADTRRTDYSSSCHPISTDLGGSTKNAAMISVPDSARKSANTR